MTLSLIRTRTVGIESICFWYDNAHLKISLKFLALNERRRFSCLRNALILNCAELPVPGCVIILFIGYDPEPGNYDDDGTGTASTIEHDIRKVTRSSCGGLRIQATSPASFLLGLHFTERDFIQRMGVGNYGVQPADPSSGKLGNKHYDVGDFMAWASGRLACISYLTNICG